MTPAVVFMMTGSLMCRPHTECEKHALGTAVVIQLVGKAVPGRSLQCQVAPVSFIFLCRGDDSKLKPSRKDRVGASTSHVKVSGPGSCWSR